MATHPPPSPLPLPPGRVAAGGGGGGKVRLVRCPKCRGLLPELPNVPLYKCGGCGATLRAKIRNEPPAASIPDHTNELENSSSSPSQATKLTSTNANSCLTSPISESCSDKEEEETNKQNTSPNGQLDCRGRKQVSDAEEEVGNNNDGCSSPDVQFGVTQRYSANSTTHYPAGDSVLLSPDILFGDSDRPSSQTDSCEQLEKSQEIVCRDSDHPSSRDEMETNTQVVITDEERSSQEEEMHIPSSTELSNNHENDMPELEEEEKLGAKSFHAYDGSVSSYEGWDDQLHHQQHIRKYTYEFDDSSGEQIRRDVPLNDKVNPRVPLPLRSRKFQTMSLNDNQVKTRMENNVSLNEEPPADITNGTNAEEKLLNSESFHTAQTSTQSQRMSDKDFYRKVPPAAFENGGPSTSMYDSDSHPVEKGASVVEHNQDELLRKVDELRERLCKSYALKLETRNEKFLKGGAHQQEHEGPMYSNHAQQRQKDPSCYRRNYPWHFSGACPPSNSVPFQGRDSTQIAMASDCRCHVGYTSLQCCPEQFQYSLQRPPVAKGCYSEQLCQIHPGYMCYHPCGSGPVNNSNFAPRICNSQPLPHAQRQHMDHKVEKQNLYPHRDRRNHIKRHCLPVAGGAPIIVCYSCKILLQLPADFILSSNRCTKLRCSSCSETLIFQLQSGRSVPFRPNPPTVPPPSEVNSTSRRSSDFSVSKENNRNRDESSVLDETSRANSRPILLEKRLHGEEVQRTSGSPLHSLMGYPSPRRLLIKRSSDIDQER
ncbi:hypothetical protein C5167_024688 [Papaver somniferum]|uniref:Uncharacterized protein n=1 Tax=Papaver somniferum TaxID=3469 RepID=A0A4Y7JPB0_PAPSO|nr:protein ENHANCED DISEASE RESISTANCE 4-like [Papaver somniferum]RZC62933.1 hypothetical protein C5167_024688 [Papaver somniferum]